MIEKITKLFILLTLVITPFVKMDSLFYPFTSGKALFFRFFLFVALFGWVILMLKDKRFRPKLNLLIISLILFGGGMFITSFLGVDIIRSIFSNFERSDGTLQFSFFVLYFLILTSVFKSKRDWQILIGSFLLVGLILSVYSWTYYEVLQRRLSGLFGNPAYFGALLLIAIGFTVVMLRESFQEFTSFLGRGITKVILFLLLLFFLISLFYTGTRGCYAGLAATFALMTFLSILFLRRNKKLVIPLVSVSGLFVIILISIFVFADHPFVKNHPIISRVKDLREFRELPSIRERLSVWQMALKGFKDRPVFGWGPENFGPIFNKYYDYQVGLNEPWFDKAHNQFLETLATGGIVLSSLYLFWVFSVFYLIFRISKKERVLAIILASIYFGYLTQGMFLFDTLPMHLFLFTFLGFVSFKYQDIYRKEEQEEKRKNLTFFSKCLVGGTALIILTLIYATVWLPYRANALALESYIAMRESDFKGAEEFFGKALEHDTPFSFSPVRKRVAWEILPVLYSIKEDISSEQIKPSLKELYHVFVSKLEIVKERHPYDPQIYLILGILYRLGGEHLEQDYLDKAEKIFEESLNYSKLRTDYYNEYAKVLLAEERYEEAKKLVQDYIKRAGREDPFVFITLGHLSFLQGDYKEAMEYYEKARGGGYKFWKIEAEYNRYLLTAQELEDYQKIVNIASEYLVEKKLSDENLAKTYYNLALGYLKLKENEKSKEYFYKAVELDEKFLEYESFFENL